MDYIIARVAVSCGLKEENLPSSEISLMCAEKYQMKYAKQMNKQEAILAFDLNIQGDLNKKIEHYQQFTVEFFCSVLNAYLEKRQQVVMENSRKTELAKESAEKKNMDAEIMQDIIADYVHFYTHELGEARQGAFALSMKMEIANLLFDFDLSEENIKALREKAKNEVLREEAKKKYASNINKKFGAEVAAVHRISRIKENKLLTVEDEKIIQHKVNSMLYAQIMETYKPKDIEKILDSAFVVHIKNQC